MFFPEPYFKQTVPHMYFFSRPIKFFGHTYVHFNLKVPLIRLTNSLFNPIIHAFNS